MDDISLFNLDLSSLRRLDQDLRYHSPCTVLLGLWQ
jgi:hypothetical protein